MQIETEKCGCLSQNYFFFSNLVDVIAALITSFLKPNLVVAEYFTMGDKMWKNSGKKGRKKPC